MEKTRTTRWRAVTRRCWRPGGKATRRWLTATSPWRNCENFLKNQRPTEKRRGRRFWKRSGSNCSVLSSTHHPREILHATRSDGLKIVATPWWINATADPPKPGYD